MLQGAGLSISTLHALAPAAAASFLAVPVAFIAAAHTHVALALLLKKLLVGKVKAGVHRYPLLLHVQFTAPI